MGRGASLLSESNDQLAWSFILKGATNMLKKISLLLFVLFILGACGQSTPNPDSFVVGMECNYAPFNWLQTESDPQAVFIESSNAYCKGYDVTIAKTIAQQLDRELEIKVLAWEGLTPALNSDSIDAIIAGMSRTPAREKEVNFTNPYYYSEYVMLVHKDSPLVQASSLSDFSNHKVVGQIGTNYDTIIDQIPDVNHLPALNSYPLIVNALLSGSADAAPAEKPTAQSIIVNNPDLVIVEFEAELGFEQNEEVTTEVSIALRKSDSQLLDQINTILNTITQQQRDTWMQEAINDNHD